MGTDQTRSLSSDNNNERVYQFLKKKNFLYVSQQRFSSTDKIPGKFFHEAKNWSKYFKRSIFVGHSDNNQFLFKKEGNFLVFGIPFDLNNSASDSVKNIFKNYLRLTILLIRIIKIFKIDLIREGNLILVGLPTLIASKITKTPFFCWLGGYERKAFGYQYNGSIISKILKKLIILLEYLILSNSNMNITVSEELYELIKRRNGSRFLSPNFVDLSIFTEKKNHVVDKTKINLFVSCRMEKEKGLDILLRAINLLSKRTSNFELNIVGYGSMKPWIENYIIEHKLEERVHLLGKFKLSDLPKFYHNCDIFIIPSYTEGLPAALLEAMATGCAIISTDVGMIPNYISDNYNGLLVSPGDPKALSEKINHLMNNTEKIIEFGEKSRKKLEKTGDYVKINSRIYYSIIKTFPK